MNYNKFSFVINMEALPLLDVIQKMEEKYIIDTENGLIKHKNPKFKRKIGTKTRDGYIRFEFYNIAYQVHRIILTKHLNREIKEGCIRSLEEKSTRIK